MLVTGENEFVDVPNHVSHNKSSALAFLQSSVKFPLHYCKILLCYPKIIAHIPSHKNQIDLMTQKDGHRAVKNIAISDQEV